MKTGKLLLASVFIFVLFFFTRFHRLTEIPLYPDEITWMVRSKETALAIRTLNFDFFKSAWWNLPGDTEAIGLPLTGLVGFPLIYLAKDQSVLSFNLFQDYVVGRTSVIVFASFFMVAFFLLVKKAFGGKVALISSLLLVFDPVFASNSKMIMNDIILTSFMFLSVATYVLLEKKPWSVFLPAFFLAASFLTKPNGLLVIPILVIQIWLNGNVKEELKKFFAVLATAGIFVAIFWPGFWYGQLGAVFDYVFRQGALVGGGINNFYAGQLTNNPPFSYYPFELLTRLPPLILFAFGLGIFSLNSLKRSQKAFRLGIVSLVFILFFIVGMSFFPKKLGARYILPVWPWVYLVASIGIVNVIQKLKNSFLAKAFVVGIFVWSVTAFVIFFPNHHLYYSMLVGGPGSVQKHNLVGLCSGSKAAVDYLLRCYPQVERISAIGCGNSTIPYYYPHPYKLDWQKAPSFVVEDYYLKLKKDPELNEFYNIYKPTHTLTANGANLSHIYIRGDFENKCK